MTRNLSWVPVRLGNVYCAPACGGRCLWDQHERARRAADKLAKRLGKGWKPQIWENLGWHFEAVRNGGRLRVMGSGRSFTVYFGRWSQRGRDPRSAVRKVGAAIKKELRGLESALRSVS